MSEITLDNHQLSRLTRDPAWLRLLPCLEPLEVAKRGQVAKKKCKPCGTSVVNAIPHADYDRVRKCVAGLLDGSSALRLQVKQKLGASSLRVKYMGTGKIVVKKY